MPAGGADRADRRDERGRVDSEVAPPNANAILSGLARVPRNVWVAIGAIGARQAATSA